MRIVACWVVGLLGAAALAAQSALGQLESMTGQKVQRFQGSSAHRYTPPASRTTRVPRATPDQRAANLMAGVFGGILSQALQSGPPSGSGTASHDERQAQIEARLAQQRAEVQARDRQALQAWAQDYSSQLNRQLLAQRGGSLEGQAAAQSGLWDGGARAPGGDSLTVDLRDARALTPGSLKPAEPSPKPVTADEVLQRRAEAQARLQRMMAENGDLTVVGQRFYELEDELARLKQEAARLGSDGRQLMREHEAWGARVDRAVQNSLERGASLLTGTLIPEGTAEGLKLLRQNPKVWNGTVEALTQVNDFTDFVTERADRASAAGEAVDWVKAKHTLFQNIDFIATNLQQVSKAWKPLSTQWELGKNIVGSGLDVAQELDAWGYQKGAAGDQLLLTQRQKAVLGKMTALAGQLQTSRETIAARLGVRPEDLIPVQLKPKGLGSAVPPI
jgi:phage shock protein A